MLGDEMVLQLVDGEDRQKFLKYARRSYVEDNRMVSGLCQAALVSNLSRIKFCIFRE